MELTTCSRCVLDTTVPEIEFDSQGVCQYCKIYDELENIYPLNENTAQRLEEIINQIKRKGKNKKYDCIVGVSGGTDSTYTLMQAVNFGLRPLAVHFDNGWNSKIAVKNIKKACDKLNVDLFTYVVDWEEFKDIQLSFLKASTPDAETPTDVGILATLFRAAAQENVKYILYGHSFRTEGVAPIGWTYYDGKYIKAIQKKFGSQKMKTYPNFKLNDFIYYNYYKRIKMIPVLNYMDYSKKDAKKIMTEKLDWEYSGGHHHESVYTHFFHSFLLPKKFNIDKRKTELSAMILSGHIQREEALSILQNGDYPYEQSIVDYTKEKFDLSKDQFSDIMSSETKSFKDYPSYFKLMKLFKTPFRLAFELNLIPKLIYLKYKNIL